MKVMGGFFFFFFACAPANVDMLINVFIYFYVFDLVSTFTCKSMFLKFVLMVSEFAKQSISSVVSSILVRCFTTEDLRYSKYQL